MKKYTEERPWGKFERFTQNEVSTVKILTVEPNQQLSVQYHHKREEFWRVIEGACEIILGEETHKAKEGDEFFVPKETKHSIKTIDLQVKIMEISLGEFDEEDIVRVEDRYGRA